MIESIGWTGATLFAISGFPQALKSWKQKHSHGISWMFLFLWSGGEVLTLIYILLTTVQWPLIFNYGFNLLCLVVIIYYRIIGGRDKLY